MSRRKLRWTVILVIIIISIPDRFEIDDTRLTHTYTFKWKLMNTL